MDSSVEMLSAAADSLVTLINNASVAEDCIGQQLCRQCSWERLGHFVVQHSAFAVGLLKCNWFCTSTCHINNEGISHVYQTP